MFAHRRRRPRRVRHPVSRGMAGWVHRSIRQCHRRVVRSASRLPGNKFIIVWHSNTGRMPSTTFFPEPKRQFPLRFSRISPITTRAAGTTHSPIRISKPPNRSSSTTRRAFWMRPLRRLNHSGSTPLAHRRLALKRCAMRACARTGLGKRPARSRRRPGLGSPSGRRPRVRLSYRVSGKSLRLQACCLPCRVRTSLPGAIRRIAERPLFGRRSLIRPGLIACRSLFRRDRRNR